MKSFAQNQYTGWFLKAAAALSFVAGVAKLPSGFGNGRILAPLVSKWRIARRGCLAAPGCIASVRTTRSFLPLALNVFVALCVTTSLEASRAEDFTVEGSIRYHVLGLTGRPIVEQEDLFLVAVSGSKWLIKKTPQRFVKAGRVRPLPEYGLAASDGTNFFEIAAPPKGPTKYSISARIGPGVVPFGLTDPKYIVLWYAFASSSFFKTNQGNYINPPTVLQQEDMYARDFRVRAEWTLVSEPPFLPAKIAFDRVFRFEENRSGKGTTNWHFTHCSFSVDEFGVGENSAIPKSVSVKYVNRNPTNAGALIPTATMSIFVTSVHKGLPTESFCPTLPAAALVSDLRTISSNTPIGVAYLSAKDWPKRETSEAGAIAISLAKTQTVVRAGRHTQLMRGLIAFVAFAPVIWLAVRKLTKRNNKQTTV